MRTLPVIVGLLGLCVCAPARAYFINATGDGEWYLHWPSDTVYLRASPVLVEAYGEDVHGVIDAAMAAWAGLDGVPTLVQSECPANPYVANAERGSGIYIARGAEWTFPREHIAETLTTWNEATGELLRTDIVLNGNKPIALTPTKGAYDLQTVLTHEMGHVLGLGHSEAPDAIMGERIGTTSVHELSRDDVRGVEKLYAEARDYDPNMWQEMGCNVVALGAGGRDPEAAIILVLVLLYVIYLARRR